MATQFITSHTSFPGSFGKLLLPLSGVAIMATRNHLTLAKRSEKVERLEKLLKIGNEDTEVKNTDANVGNGQLPQMSFMSEENTKDHYWTQRPHTRSE